MAVYKYDNGKIVSLETGATPMPKLLYIFGEISFKIIK